MVLSVTCSRKSVYDFLLLFLLQRMPDVQVCPAVWLSWSSHIGDFILDSSEDLRAPCSVTQFNSFSQLVISHPDIK